MPESVNPDLTLEFASDDPSVDVTLGFLGQTRINEDKVLRAVGGNLEVYEDVYRDDRVLSTLQQRITAVISQDYDVRPGGESPLDIKASEAAKEMIRSIKFDRLTEKLLLQSLLKGWGVAEIIWSIKGDLLWPAAAKVKRSQRFTFAPQHTIQPASNKFEDVRKALRLESSLRLKTRTQPLNGEVLPERKFIVHSVGGLDDDNPFGTGFGFWLYWPVRFKREGMSLWLQFIDKFGAPSVKGTYPNSSGDPEKRKLMEALRALRSNSVTAIPEGMSAELIQAAKSGISTHEQLIDRMDQAITTVVLSQTLTTSQGSSGSQALGKVHEGIKDGIAKSDADMLSDTLNETLMFWFTEFNFPSATPPHIWRDMSDTEGLDTKAERDERIANASGRVLDKTYAEDEYGIKLSDEMKGASSNTASASFAEASSDIDAVNNLADQLEAQAAPITDKMIDQIRVLMDEVESLEELADRIPELLGEINANQLTELMAKAFATANLTGQVEVVDESNA